MYREFRPEGDVVDCVWVSTRVGVQRVVPDGCMDIMWVKGSLEVAGPDTRAHLAEVDGYTVGVRFRPGMAPGFLGIPGNELRDTRVPLDRLWSRERVEWLTENIHKGLPGQALLQAVGEAREDTFAAAVKRLLHNDIRDIAETLNVSERQLHRRCLTRFGYGPKTLQRVIRFSHAMDLAYNGQAFADIAHQTGYADQAHLAREVKDLAGATLSELVRTPT
ncbi:helix-turn-helix transcriptional regulator [Actinocrispum sp. NPDC049592]|uniref:helix-turn-helix transcriptional regulator n=1 Tax=Actinocrispum sp. NPDC049592 TaxID=3154835 RepID=UPI00342A845A